MDSNGYYTGKHNSFMLPPVNNYQIQYDSYNDYQTSSQVHQQQQQQQQQHQQQQQLPHQVQQHHDIQSTISVKLDTINKSPSQKNDEIQACSGGYTGNSSSSTSSNDFHGNLYHYNKNLDSSDGIAAYNQPSVVSSYSDFDHVGGTSSSITQKSLSSFLLPQSQQIQQSHNQHPPTAAIIPQAIGNVQNDISQQSKVLGTFDQRTSSKCYNSKPPTTATNSLHGYQQSGYKDSEMQYNFNKLPQLPPIPHTYHHVFPSYDKYSIQQRPTNHHKSYDDNPTNSRPYVCQTMPMAATNHKPASQSELYCSSSATATEQLNRYSNRNLIIPNSAFTTPANGYYTPMYHRSNNVHRNLSLPPPLQPAVDDSSNYYHNNSLLVRGGSYNRSQMAYQQNHYPYARTHHPMPIPKLQSKSDLDIMSVSGLTDEIYRPTYNVSYDHFDDYQYSQVPPSVTHYPAKSSKVIYAPYSSNSMNSYPPSTTHQQSLSTAHQQQQQQQQHHNIHQQQQHHPSVIQNQVLSSNDYSRYSCSNVQPTPVNCSNKVYLQDQYVTYPSHPQMIYSHNTSEVAQTEMPAKFNQMYDKHTTQSTDKMALIDLEEQITGSKILKSRELMPSKSYDCYNGNNNNNNNNSYQQLRVNAEHEASKNQSLRDFLVTWNDDEDEEGEAVGEKKQLNPRRIAAVEVMPRNGQSKELDGVAAPKIHYGIKVDNSGAPTNNLPDIIIDIEKPKVVGGDESYSSVTDKLYVLESIHVPFSDLNKYKHLNVVNKLPDNIVQIGRPKGDSLDDVEETLKLMEKCEEQRVRLHKSDFESDVKFEAEACVSPIRRDCCSAVSPVGHEEDIMLNDPLNIHEIPLDADQHTVPVPAPSPPSPTVRLDDENLSNAHDKTADDGQENDDDIDDDETMVRYKCVQKKVSTNDDALIHSDVFIPKLKIKIMRRKRSKSFRNRKNKSCSDSSDSHDEIKLRHLDETISQVKTLQLICLDVVNTNSFRKYLISMKENESQNSIQHSGGPIENHIECGDELKTDGESINTLAVVDKEIPSDLIESKQFCDSAVGSEVSDDQRKTSSQVSDEETEKFQSTIDNNDPPNNPHSPNRLDHSLHEFKFPTPLLVDDDFADDPHFDTNFESVRTINLGNNLPSIDTDATNKEISSFCPIRVNESTTKTLSFNVDDINNATESIDITSNTTEQTMERSDRCLDNIQEEVLLAPSLFDNLEKTAPSNREQVSQLMESLDEFQELIESSDNPKRLPENSSAENIVVSSASTNFTETQVLAPIESNAEFKSVEGMTNNLVFKTEPIKSDYSDSSSSSCSSSDDSSDSETEVTETKRQSNVSSVANTVRVSNSSLSSSDESDDLDDDKSSEGSSRQKINSIARHTDSESVSTKSSSNESAVTEPKVKMENELNHRSDDGFKSSSYSSSSSSDNSDESSADSDDDTVSDSVAKIEKKRPDENSSFVAMKIKTEELHSYSDTTDESSIESCDETESETAIKQIARHDKEILRSSSSSDSSDDERVSQSPIKSALTENDIESSKTSSDTELSEEDDKKSCSSNPSSLLSVTEKSGSLTDSITESETCTADTATPVSISRKISSSNSNESYMQETSDIRSDSADCGKPVMKDFIKTEPINEDSHVFNSCSDNSDDEYVTLSPLNQLDECSRTNNHTTKLSQLSETNAIMASERSKKPIQSSDGYSTSSSSSSSSSQSSSSDEYSSDDDDVFDRKSEANVKIDSIALEPMKTIKNEIEEHIDQGDVQVNQEEVENRVVQLETPSEVAEEVVHNSTNDSCLYTIDNNTEEIENTVEVMNDHLPSGDENLQDTLLDDTDQNAEEKHHDSSDIVPNETIESVEALDEVDSDSKNFDEDVMNCSASDSDIRSTANNISEQNVSTKFDVVISCSGGNDGENGPTVTESIDFVKHIEDIPDIEADSCRTSCNESSDNSEVALTDDEVDSKTSISIDDNHESIESNDDNEIDSENFASSMNKKSDDHELNVNERDEVDSDMPDRIDVVHSVAVSLQSCEPIKMDSQIVPPIVETIRMNVSDDQTLNNISLVETATIHPQPELIDNHITEVETIDSIEAFLCNEEEASKTLSTSATSVSEKSAETESVAHVIESSNQESTAVQISEIIDTPIARKDLIYPVLDIPVKLIPLPGERFNEELYQKLIDNSEIFPSRQAEEIEDLNDFYSKIPLALIPLPNETIDEQAPPFVEYKRKYLEDRKNTIPMKSRGNIEGSIGVSTINVTNQASGSEHVCQSLPDPSPFSPEHVQKNLLVIRESIPSLKVLCQKVLSVAGLHYDDDDELAASIDGDSENISYFYVVNDYDDFWNCSNESSPPLIVCYDGELDDDVFVESDFSVANNLTENLATFPDQCSITSQSLSVDSFTIDSHDIQYEEIVPVNRTMYKLENFKRYLQSKYIQKPNYIQIYCINKILKKYSNYQRYRKRRVHGTATVQNCKNRIENYKNLIKHPKNNETLPLATDRFTVNDNGQVHKNDVLRSNCDINKSKLLLLTNNNNNIKSKRNLNSTPQRCNRKLNKCEVSTISSYVVSELTKNNHLKESRAFAKEIITNKQRSIKSNAKVAATPIATKSKIRNDPLNQIAIHKRKVSETVAVEPMITRNNKKRKLSFDDTLLGINRIYKQSSSVYECEKIETKASSSSSYKLKERSNVYFNSNILNNSKDKVRRLIIPKSKIFDGLNVSTKSELNSLVQVPYVKLVRNPYIDSLSKSYVKSSFTAGSRK